MNPKFMKMLEKKKDLKPHHKMAAMHALKGMKDAASDMASDKLGLHKVSVMSDSPEGLQHGLHSAENVVNQMPDESPEMNMGGMSEGGPVGDMGEGSEDNRNELENIDQDMEEEHGGSETSQAADEVEHKTEEENPGLPHSDEPDSEQMDHEHAEDMDLDAIKEKIAHLMGLQSKAESKLRK